MSQLKTVAFKKVQQLVSRFEEQKEFYLRTQYNETLTRQDFINPFFKALGWDIDNEQGYAESYREVIHEERIKINGGTKAPDYSFRLAGGKRLFFVEAKKPSVLIKNEIIPAYQVRRYGWSAKLPVSIITDFQEFAVYDCTKKPNPGDKASTARIKYLTYPEYLNEFDFIWDTFSKERVLKGSFDKFVQSDTYKKGTATVDNDFLNSLDKWRTYLATSLYSNNKKLNEDEINFVVQQTIDRIIFLRIAEDRRVEPYGNLKDCIKFGNFYQNLNSLFIRADEKYNSGLFDFNKDKISQHAGIDNKVVKTIVSELYYPECPYEFAVLPVEILGTAYEQFLGKQIRIDSSHKIRIEEKPEVRKSGGVYYTPQYIVEQLVESTLGKVIKGKTPKEISRVKIIDPACGSGSFLLGAFQYLLDYHKHYYNSQKIKSSYNILTPDGNLTSREKKRILLNNIFGVDIDLNAVEVTKLSLLLKCMEGETEASISTQMLLFHDRVLPTLDNNIKNGNSLIGTHVYNSRYTNEEIKKIKPFDWNKAFPEIFIQGGFNIVVGNPPYVQSNVLDKASQAYINSNYTAHSDLYSAFIEKSIELIAEGGSIGFIVPSLFLKGIRYQNLRQLINESCASTNIKEYGDKVFQKVQMPTCTIVLTKGKRKKVTDHFINQNQRLFHKVKTITLGSISTTTRGLEIGKDKLNEKGSVKCLSGSNLDSYRIKGNRYIDKEVLSSVAKNLDIFTSPKIITRETGDKLYSTIDYSNLLTTRSIYNTKIIDKAYSCEFVLGIINSHLFSFYFKEFIAPDTKIFPKIRIVQLKELPIPKHPLRKSVATIEQAVLEIININQELENIKLASALEQLKNKIAYYKDKINSEVYSLYQMEKEDIIKINSRIGI